MGKAYQAPASKYRRTFVITEHVLERFRERCEFDVKARAPEDIGNLLDEKLRDARALPRCIRDIRDRKAPDDITQLVEIEMRHELLFVVMRDNTAVTLVDEAMAAENFKNGKWTHVVNTPFQVLKHVTPIAKPAPAPAMPSPPLAPTPPELSPLEAAGIAHARALRAVRDGERLTEDLEARLREARADLAERHEAVRDAFAALTKIVTE